MSEKIVVTVRTLNEEKNIGRFCMSYQWADLILVADGGSEDETIYNALLFPNVKVRVFNERVYGDNGLWRNPHGRHLNFLFDWAEEEGAGWIIHDDCDSVPNHLLRNTARRIFETKYLPPFVSAQRMYVWGNDKYFVGLSKPKDAWVGSLWAWRTGQGFRASEVDPWKHEFIFNPTDRDYIELLPPLCLLHYFCPNPKTAEKKRTFYDRSGEIPRCKNPIDYGGELMDLPEWAYV